MNEPRRTDILGWSGPTSVHRSEIRRVITNAYYGCCNEGETMESAADRATDAVLDVLRASTLAVSERSAGAAPRKPGCIYRHPHDHECLDQNDMSASAAEVAPLDMCPNCVTPWKCNGPHLPAERSTGAAPSGIEVLDVATLAEALLDVDLDQPAIGIAKQIAVEYARLGTDR